MSRKGKDSVAEDVVLSFDGNFQEIFHQPPSSQENGASCVRIKTGEESKIPLNYSGCFDLS
jgi:hypothetical protein